MAAPVACTHGGARGPAVAVTAGLAWLAGAVHLVLAPEHFEERTAYGVFFLTAALFQLWLGWRLLRGPTRGVLTAGAGGSLLLIATWLVTRAVAPPLSPEGRAEPVTLLGVLATGAELAALVLLVGAVPIAAAPTQRRAVAWAVTAGSLFAAFVLLASNALSYVSPGTHVPALRVYWGRFSLYTPIVYGRLVPGVWLIASWSTLLFVAVGAVLYAANVAALLARRPGSATGSPRRAAISALPAFLTVSGCCGAPLALFLGTSAVVALVRLTPVLLLATIVLLTANLVVLRGAAVSRVPAPAGGRPSPREGATCANPSATTL